MDTGHWTLGWTLHSGRVPLLLLGRSHFYRFIQIFLKFTKIYDKILKIFAQKLTRPELGKGVKVPSKVKDKQLLEVMKQVRPAGGGAGPLSGDQMNLK